MPVGRVAGKISLWVPMQHENLNNSFSGGNAGHAYSFHNGL